MIFSEIYGAYYNAVAAVLREAVAHPVSDADIRRIVDQHAFGESILTIPSALKEGRWKLLKPDGTAVIQNAPSMPLSLMQKRWLKAVARDPRIKLFGDFDFDFPDVEPLFLPEDVIVFDQYADGDDYTNADYIANFRIILDAVRNGTPLYIKMRNKIGEIIARTIFPSHLEYSEKDDKFRLIGTGSGYGNTVNLGRIIHCEICEGSCKIRRESKRDACARQVTFELTDQRNALERVLLHFAHFEKTAERIDESRYAVTVRYNLEDETEMVIRILSFGPMIRVTAPERFIKSIRQRLIDQIHCEQ